MDPLRSEIKLHYYSYYYYFDVRHFVTVAQPNVVASVFYCFAIYHMSGCNNMRYKYYRICFGICMQSL